MLIQNFSDILILISPLIVCFASSFLCKIKKNAGSNVIFRPPSWVFGIVWSILFILLGLSFLIAKKSIILNPTSTEVHTNFDIDPKTLHTITIIIYLGIILALASWIIIYGCFNDKIYAFWTFIPIFIFVLLGFCTGNKISKMLLCPLIAWLIFAMFLGSQELHNSSQH